MPYYIYFIKVRGKEIKGKIFALNLEHFLDQIYDMYKDFSYLKVIKVVDFRQSRNKGVDVKKMNDYTYWVELKNGKVINGKITALNLQDFLDQVEKLHGSYSYLHFKIKGD